VRFGEVVRLKQEEGERQELDNSFNYTGYTRKWNGNNIV